MLILTLLQAGGAVPNTQVAPWWNISINSLKYGTTTSEHKIKKLIIVYSVEGKTAKCNSTCTSAKVWGRPRAVRVNIDQLHVRGMATDRLLMRLLSALVLSSPPGAPVDALHLISIEFHSTGLVYSKYICFN